MSNVFQEVGHGLKVAAVDVAKGVEDAVLFLPKAEKVIATAIQHQPAVKTAVLGLISQAEKVISDTAAVSVEKGIDLAADATALADAEAFFTYFKGTFIPAIESVYAEVKQDIATS